MIHTINPAGIQYKETFSGVAYRATLLQDGVAVGCVQHNGDGGGAFVADLEHDFDYKMFKSEAEKYGSEELYIEHLMDVAEGVS